VLWAVDQASPLTETERSPYDLVLSGAEDPDRFADRLLAAVEALLAKTGFRRRIDGEVT
jgi:hypothetical protein